MAELTTAIVTGLTTVSASATSIVTDIAPVALGLFSLLIVIRYGKTAFKALIK